MSLKILEHKKNPLMERDEVKAVFEHHGKPTPTRGQIMPSLESVLKADAERILIRKIFSEKGKGESLVTVHVYDKKEALPKMRMDILRKRVEKAKGKAEAKAPPAAEAKKEVKAEHKTGHPGK
ncbi:hypothetical protein H0O02_00455 [Candidatus Micrarchaeota archaeon]|nr:hypothetical protein [Candidatus Micrarchaeota archaeon]